MSKDEKREGVMRARDVRRIDQDPERLTGKSKQKNTKRWCKGKVGREHKPALVLRSMWGHRTCDPTSTSRWFGCYHQEVCGYCGKVLRWSIPRKECPQHPDNRIARKGDVA